MCITRSAKASFALGATLIVCSASVAAATSASSLNGIDSNGVLGIDSNGVQGIDSNGVAGIDSNGILGIDSNGVAGIDSNGILGIDSNGVAGIDSNGILGIDSNGVAGIDSNGLLGVPGQTILAGPVDSIDRINGVFESMGQVVMASYSMLSGMQVGDFVAVQGTVISSGWYFADNVSVSNQLYVPGSTEVFISGMLSSINRMDGTAQMGRLTIDFTSSLGSSDAPSGDMWTFRGTRPSMGGTMLSYRTEAIK
ncbi:MAG: hypothetical protein IH838_06430 [Proteobacteria bacterium]|nr:hypothetical protein [Pseudomonadota bacterium]